MQHSQFFEDHVERRIEGYFVQIPTELLAQIIAER